MLTTWDLLLPVLVALPALLVRGYRWRADRRGGTMAGYQAVLFVAGVLVLAPEAYFFTAVIPRLGHLYPGVRFLAPVLAAMAACLAAGLLLLLWQAYHVDRLLRRTHWTLWQFIGFHLRVVALVVLPMALVGGSVAAVAGIPWVREWGEGLTETQRIIVGVTGASLLLSLVTFLLMPFGVKWMLRTKPLEDPALRESLIALGERLGVPVSDIRVMALPGARMANALVTGFTKTQRAVIVTNGMLEHLTPAEVEAVFAHEIGHIRCRHLWTRLGIQTVAMVILGLAGAAAGRYLGEEVYFFPVLLVGVVLLPSLAISPILREQEFAADRYAAIVTEGRALASALEKLEQINLGRKPGRMPDWLQWLQAHPRTTDRVARLRGPGHMQTRLSE